MGRPGVVALVVLLALSGCQTFGSGTPRETLTPPPVPEATATAATGLSLPPGVDSTGVTSPARLVAAHRAALEGRSYVLRLRYVERYANGTRRATVTWRNSYGSGGSARTIRVRNFSDIGLYNYSTVTWSNGRIVVSRIATDGEVRFLRPVEIPFSFTGGRQLFVVLLRGEFDVARLPDRSAYRLTLTSVEGTRPLVRSYTFSPEVRENPRNVSLRLVVTRASLVRNYRLAYDTTVNGATVHVVQSIRLEGIGTTTVERPSWVGEALAKTNATG